MFSLMVKISHIDYSAISNKIIPIILENRANEESAGKLVQILSKHKNLPGIAANAALKVLPQDIKDDIAVYLIKSYENQLLEAANNFMKNKQLNIKFKEITVDKKEDIELGFNVESIDYNALIGTAYPLIMSKFSANTKFNKLFGMFEKLDGYSEKLIRAAMETLSEEEKDELVVCAVSTYEEEIISFINAFTDEKGLKTTFAGAEMKKI